MKQGDVIVKNLYPIIKGIMDKKTNNFKHCVGRFMTRRNAELFDIAPCSRIYFGEEDIKDFYTSIGIDEKTIKESIKDAYYFDIPSFNPRAAKDEFTVAVLCIIRYFVLAKKEKEIELSSTYLAFSGKFYPSIHSGSFPVVQPSEYRHIMEYAINNELSNRFDIKKEKSIFGVIKSICNTWINSYEERFKSFDDEDVVYLIQQLHSRIKSFMKNIAEVYYKLYAEKDKYITYDSDSLDDSNYHLADSDSLRMERYVEKTMTAINSSSIDYMKCRMASDKNVRTDEVKSIIESILSDNNNMIEVKELIRLIIVNYLNENKGKEISDVNFVTVSTTPKPNSKDKNVIRQKQIIENWLNENSPQYRKRKSRESTKSSYYKSVLTYFTLMIYYTNK